MELRASATVTSRLEEEQASSPGTVVRLSDVISVSPDQAREWLKTGEQVVRTERVNRYKSEMSEGRWELGKEKEAITIKDGKLGDGYHRLAAVLELGRPVDLLVIINEGGA